MKRLPAVLAAAVVLRMAFHAVYLPAFEGPDEPHHLARILAFARGPLGAAFVGRGVDPSIVASVKAYPCAPALSKAYGCPAFGREPGTFDLLRPEPPMRATGGTINPEANQPPLYYAFAGLLMRPFPLTVPAALLFSRFLSVALVAVALFGPLRALAASAPPGAAICALLALLLPGASEALARCSNDAAVFLWASAVLAALGGGTRDARLALLLGAGPLLKLTAIPIVVFGVFVLVQERRQVLALSGALISLLVFPVQAARGWMWGGTVELNLPGAAAASNSPFELLAGLTRSSYAFVKTIFWVSGWSLLRPPRFLVISWGALLVATLLCLRCRPGRWLAHAAAALVAAAGFTFFAIVNKRFYGDWGGVAGWYFWDWSPWIAVGVVDVSTTIPAARRLLLWSWAAFSVVANIIWFAAHGRFYG